MPSPKTSAEHWQFIDEQKVSTGIVEEGLAWFAFETIADVLDEKCPAIWSAIREEHGNFDR